MGFDAPWFEELRRLDDVALAKVTHPRGFRPAMDELYTARVISQNFILQTMDLVKALQKTKYPFERQFVAYERHICNFPRGKAFRKQWNIGFTAGIDSDDDYVRIGIGFQFGLLEQESVQRGVDEYLDFLERIKRNSAAFDNTFKSLGNYTEPEYLSHNQSLSQSVLADQNRINFQDDWRFFGKKLRFADPRDREIITSTDHLVREMISVFDHITQSGFGFN